jgi:3-phenylpropionate/trans-cinnamate dioxygenase ferredoxin reductase subunit
MNDIKRVVVVGASAAGLAAAEALRTEGYRGEIHLVGAEAHLPYDRPPLSKQILTGAWPTERLALRPEAHYGQLDLTIHRGQKASGLDLARQVVSFQQSPDLPFDRLIIATGANARRMSLFADAPNVFHLRTLEDALALSALFRTARRLAIVGAGFVGTEVAAAARQAGIEVTLIDAGPAPLAQRLGPMVAGRIARLHEMNGVTLRMGVSVAAAGRTAEGLPELQLSDGSVCACDAVLVAIGAEPATDWLKDTQIALGNGVECDQYCRAADTVFAAGDVASWFHPGYGRQLRIEHRTNATEQAGAAVRNLLGMPAPYAPIPFFWSDQYGLKLQSFGILSPDAEVAYLHGAPDADRFVLGYYEQQRLIGVLGWNTIRETRAHVPALRALWANAEEAGRVAA